MNLSNHYPEIRWEWSDAYASPTKVVEFSKYLLQRQQMQGRIHELERELIALRQEQAWEGVTK